MHAAEFLLLSDGQFGLLAVNFSLARPSGTNLANRLSFGTTSVSSSRTVARASTTALPGQPVRRPSSSTENPSISPKRSGSGNSPG